MPPITLIQCPQQTNSYDCGVYVLLYTQHIAKLLIPRPQPLTSDLITQSVAGVLPDDCQRYRREVRSMILEMVHMREERRQNK